MTTFGDRVRAARRHQMMSQHELAERVGVSQSLIAGIERGNYAQSKSVFALAAALGVDPSWLANGEGSEPLKELAAQRARMAEHRRARLNQFVEEKAEGSVAQLSRIVDWNPRILIELVGGKRRIIADKLARDLEKEMGVPAGWLDMPLKASEGGQPEAPDQDQSQIIVWENREDLPPDDGRVWIDRYDYQCSAGNGLIQWEIREKQALPFNMDFFRAVGASPQHSKLMTVRGNSMEPLLFDRDMMMVDTSKTTVKDGKIYAVCLDDEPLVKQVFRQAGGGLTLHSFNPQYPDRTLSPEDLQYIQIIGQLIYRSGGAFA